MPPGLEKIVLHALAKKPDFRFKSMDEFRTALRDPERFAAELDASTARLTPGEGLPAPRLPASLPSPSGAPAVQRPPSAPAQLASDAPTVQGQAPPEVQALLAARAAQQQNGINSAPTQRYVLGAVTNPRQTPVFVAGAGVTPATGLRVGVSVGHGAYATPDEITTPASRGRLMTMAGGEGEWAFGGTKVGGEILRTSFETMADRAIATALSSCPVSPSRLTKRLTASR